jgi:chitin disaccharide deacetylase
MATALRRIWLCADDYGISPGVSAGIREVIARERINATSVMTASPHFNGEEAAALAALNSGKKRAAIGLHVVLTAPFKPLSADFPALREGRFLPLNSVLRAATTRRLQSQSLVTEIAAQFRAFNGHFGHPPDFVDGHQHVQLFPQIRDAFLRVVTQKAPNAWARQCGRARLSRRSLDRKALLLDILSVAFRRKARRLGIPVNPGFAGTYSFSPRAQFAKLFPHFLSGLPDGGLIMCHPGFVDVELNALDSLTAPREQELAFFNSSDFPSVLAKRGVALIPPTGENLGGA